MICIRHMYDYQTADPLLYPLLKEYARRNRNNPTPAEELLWNYISSNGLGKTFKRQHIIGDYIADFVCLSNRLLIELDGGYHQLPQQQRNDAARTEWLEKKGFTVIRFSNDEVLKNIEYVLKVIKEKLND